MTIQELSEKIESLFNRGELKDLCFHMNIPYDNIPGETRKEKTQELVLYSKRHGRLEELVKTCAIKRPNETWGDLIEPGEIDSASLETIQNEIYRLQRETIDALKARRLSEADRKLEQTDDLIDDGLKQWPENLLLLNLKGYHHKNVAMEYQRLSMSESADEHLDIAEKTFRLILTQDENDANAWNGLGSVYMLRYKPDQAEAYIRKALEINPEHSGAKHDLAYIIENSDKFKR